MNLIALIITSFLIVSIIYTTLFAMAWKLAGILTTMLLAYVVYQVAKYNMKKKKPRF